MAGKWKRNTIPVYLVALVAPLLAARDEPNDFLLKSAQLSRSQIEAFGRGEPVAQILTSPFPVEIPVFGTESISVPVPFFMKQYSDIARFKSGKEVLQIGKFSDPPRLQDLDALVLDEGEVNSLRSCVPGDCSFKLTAEMIGRIRAGVRWDAKDCIQQATVLFRRLLWDQLNAYRVSGNAALPVYLDKKEPVRMAEQFQSLVQNSPYLQEYVPELRRYLLESPGYRPPDTERFYYWSKEKFGYKPVVSLTEVTMYRMSRQGADAVVIASKQIYANHYFLASLGLSALAQLNRSGVAAGGWLFYLNRSRADIPGGMFSGIIRYFIKRRLLSGLEKYLVLVRQRLEREYAANPAG
jgi:hypothetical protein